ncbi:MAG: Transposon gamma-delta resolvase [Pelotomaculum sp. PtaB.Bin013]|uniref:Recombinase family protein n=1 Tax=Pelotomaculum isophthalicicum JI TaxID=947010 RepID=A0A9X4JTX9_9FIRM|nr:recombinase family protein [Pelotomaculum isophthalicicum]MDF9409489.1 recombinase family protein [Pelotomaculum isophthalicicum JI]OPX92213.1 MAG: Transposon gamma-delta resolvase [Pelotomaculum sp. PtaB.Bin013]
MQAAIYVRVSTDDQVRHGFSLAEQKAACRNRAAALGASVITEFADEGISGSTMDRPGLTALRSAVRNNQVDLLVVRDPDRLSRKLSHQLLLTEEFEKAGVKIEFLDFDWKDTPEGRLFYSVRGAIAEYEREKIRDRMVRGKDQKARQGGVPIGFYNYGYNYTPDSGKVTVNDSEAPVVINIFNWFVYEDIGMNGVARRLNEMGIPTRKGKGKWHRNVIRQILRNPVYVGFWRYKEFSIQVPDIVNGETWNKAQEKLKEARRLWAGLSKNEYLLSGLISCSECGNTMTGVYTNWWDKRERRYTCHKNSQGAKSRGCVPAKFLPAEVIENAVWEQVQVWLNDPDTLAKEAVSEEPREEELRQELDRIEEHLKGVEKGRNSILDTLALGLVELDTNTKNKLTDLKRRKERLENRKKELEAVLSEAYRYISGLEELRLISRQILSKLNSLDFSDKKALIRTLVSQVIIAGRGQPGRNGLKDTQVTIVAKLPEQIDSSVFSDIVR